MWFNRKKKRDEGVSPAPGEGACDRGCPKGAMGTDSAVFAHPGGYGVMATPPRAIEAAFFDLFRKRRAKSTSGTGRNTRELGEASSSGKTKLLKEQQREASQLIGDGVARPPAALLLLFAVFAMFAMPLFLVKIWRRRRMPAHGRRDPRNDSSGNKEKVIDVREQSELEIALSETRSKLTSLQDSSARATTELEEANSRVQRLQAEKMKQEALLQSKVSDLASAENNISRLKENANQYLARQHELEGKVRGFREEIERLEAARKELEAKYSGTVAAERASELDRLRAQAAADLSSRLEENAELQASARDAAARAATDNNELIARLEVAVAGARDAEDRAAGFRARVEELSAARAEAAGAQDAAAVYVENAAEVASLSREVKDLREAAAVAGARTEELQAAVTCLETREEGLRMEVEGAKERLKVSMEEALANKESMRELEAQHDSQAAGLERALALRDSALKRSSALEAQLEKAKSQLAAVTTHRGELAAKVSELDARLRAKELQENTTAERGSQCSLSRGVETGGGGGEGESSPENTRASSSTRRQPHEAQEKCVRMQEEVAAELRETRAAQRATKKRRRQYEGRLQQQVVYERKTAHFRDGGPLAEPEVNRLAGIIRDIDARRKLSAQVFRDAMDRFSRKEEMFNADMDRERDRVHRVEISLAKSEEMLANAVLEKKDQDTYVGCLREALRRRQEELRAVRANLVAARERGDKLEADLKAMSLHGNVANFEAQARVGRAQGSEMDPIQDHIRHVERKLAARRLQELKEKSSRK